MQIPNFDSRSDAYKKGYDAYKSWFYNGGDRPINPYDGDIDDEHTAYLDWYQGWEDASFEC